MRLIDADNEQAIELHPKHAEKVQQWIRNGEIKDVYGNPLDIEETFDGDDIVVEEWEYDEIKQRLKL